MCTNLGPDFGPFQPSVRLLQITIHTFMGSSRNFNHYMVFNPDLHDVRAYSYIAYHSMIVCADLDRSSGAAYIY